MPKMPSQNSTSIPDRRLKDLTIAGLYLNLVKFIYHKLTKNIILNGEKLEEFILKLGSCQLTPLLLSVALEILDRAITQEKET